MKNFSFLIAILTCSVIEMTTLAEAAEPELWPISIEGKMGYIDSAGTEKIKPQYASAGTFSDGLALVSIFTRGDTNRPTDPKRQGFIDSTGRFVIPAETPLFLRKETSYGYSSFEDGVAVVTDGSGSEAPRGLIDRTGKLIVPMKYDEISSFGEELCTAEKGNQRGYMNYKGEFMLKPKNFLYGMEFSESRAVIVTRDERKDDEEDQYLVIDRKGRIVVGPNFYTSISSFYGELARVEKDEEDIRRVGLIDREGRVVVPLGKYEQIMEPDPGLLYIGELNGKYFSINSKGEASPCPDFGAEPVRYRGDLIWIEKDDKFGYAKPDGTIVVPPMNEDLGAFEGQLAKFRKGEEQGYIDRSGKVVWSTPKWKRPIRNSIRDPLKGYLPEFVIEAIPLSYNWDCENAIGFVCDGKLDQLRKDFLSKRSPKVKVRDDSDTRFDPGKLALCITVEAVANIELFAAQGDVESKDAELADGFVDFYSCKNMDTLRKKYPGKTIGILIEN